MPTIKEIAELANVSSSTVSRILNGDESIQVSLETRKRVLAVAEKLNYIVKSNKNTNNTIGTIAITNWYTKEITLADLFMRSILWGLESTLKTAGYKIIRSDFNDSLPDENTIDGIIAVGEYHGKNMQQLRNLNKPLVIINQDTLYEDISCVTIDFKYSVTKIIEYFEQEGHEKIGMIEGKNKYSLKNHIMDPRAKTFRDEMKKRGKLNEDYIFLGDFSIDSGYQQMIQAIDTLKEDLPTAFFINSDTMAIGALRALNERQIPCPEQVRIIGFGNVEVGNYMTPKLSTVELNASQMGTYGAILIQSIMNGQQNTPVNIITGTKLLIKET